MISPTPCRLNAMSASPEDAGVQGGCANATRRGWLQQVAGLALVGAAGWGVPRAWAADEAADAFVRRLSADLLDVVKGDRTLKTGDVQRIAAVVDARVMPHLNFRRMTASAVGPAWRQATPEQQARLQDEFKALLIRTYAGALAQVKDQTIQVKPLRAAPDDTEVLVRSEIRGGPEPIQLDYRLEKTPGQGWGWKIYNLNVMGVWLVDTYRTQFGQEINARGIDGLIASLTERNKSGARP
jgi:phospholipid transport system substrate-binding protein